MFLRSKYLQEVQEEKFLHFSIEWIFKVSNQVSRKMKHLKKELGEFQHIDYIFFHSYINKVHCQASNKYYDEKVNNYALNFRIL